MTTLGVHDHQWGGRVVSDASRDSQLMLDNGSSLEG